MAICDMGFINISIIKWLGEGEGSCFPLAKLLDLLVRAHVDCFLKKWGHRQFLADSIGKEQIYMKSIFLSVHNYHFVSNNWPFYPFTWPYTIQIRWALLLWHEVKNMCSTETLFLPQVLGIHQIAGCKYRMYQINRIHKIRANVY